ncbi:unnamed protein product [Linum tenue]|uniref:Uncharacterized protein n=1 Tax=Linum tenue TaxID=586396 RepID=A0AAV0K3G6_9ROSI|nr:unnamed protein product [Linum tenue]
MHCPTPIRSAVSTIHSPTPIHPAIAPSISSIAPFDWSGVNEIESKQSLKLPIFAGPKLIGFPCKLNSNATTENFFFVGITNSGHQQLRRVPRHRRQRREGPRSSSEVHGMAWQRVSGEGERHQQREATRVSESKFVEGNDWVGVGSDLREANLGRGNGEEEGEEEREDKESNY